MPITSQLLRPVRGWFITMTLALALLADLLPWGPIWTNLVPDFVILLVLYWSLNLPRRVSVGTAFSLGILMDVGDGAVLGQHALAYSVVTGLLLMRQRQIAVYPFRQQALIVLALLLVTQLIMVAVRIAVGDQFAGWTYFLGSFLSAVLWTPLSNLMLLHQRQSVPDEL